MPEISRFNPVQLNPFGSVATENSVPGNFAPDALAQMMDIAEELGFMEVEKKRLNADLAKEKMDQVRHLHDDLALKALEQMQMHVPATQLEEEARQIRNQVILAKTFATEQAVWEKYFTAHTHGSKALGLLYLETLVKAAKVDSRLAQLGYSEETLRDYAKLYQREITAYLNIEQALQAHQQESQTGAELMALYERTLVQTQSVMGMWAQLGQLKGMGTWTNWRFFLMQSVGLDLLGAGVGADKVHLQHVLSELKSLRMMNTLVAQLERLQEQRMKGLSVSAGEVLQTTCEFADEPLMKILTLEDWLMASTLEEQILFFQDYRQVLMNVPDECYLNEEQKSNTRGVLQRRIDELVYSE